MQTAQRRVGAPIYNVVDGLAANTYSSSQFSITYVFFIVTRRRFSCDSYFFFSFFIVVKF